VLTMTQQVLEREERAAKRRGWAVGIAIGLMLGTQILLVYFVAKLAAYFTGGSLPLPQ
jgi:tetrahydromethanopterin S-methyltransferase subunit G